MQKIRRCRLPFLVALASLAACGAPDGVPVDRQPTGPAPQSFKASINQSASGDPSRSASTLSVATTTLGKGTAVIGYASKPVGAPTAAWSFSLDAGASWSAHRSDEEGEFHWPDPPVSSDSFAYYGDAPTMISLDAFPGVVVAVVSAYGTQAAAIDVILLLSTDGGAHFKDPRLVYTEYLDQAGAAPAIEYVTAGPLIGSGEGAGATVWTLFRNHKYWAMHRYTYDPISQRLQTVIENYSPYINLNLDETTNKIPTGPASILATFNAMGKETVYIAWPSYDNQFDTCPSQTPLSPTVDVRWRLSFASVVDKNNNLDTSAGIDLDHDTSWPRCLGDGTELFKNNPRSALVMDPVSHTFWVAHNRSVAKAGSEVVVHRVPETLTNLVGGAPLSATLNDSGGALAGVHDQWAPSLALVHPVGALQPTVAVAWHDMRDDPASPGTRTSIWGAFTQSEAMDPAEPLVFSAGRITPLIPGPQAVPWALTDYWGRYDGMAANPATGDFLVAWGDNRSGGKTQVWTSRIAP